MSKLYADSLSQDSMAASTNWGSFNRGLELLQRGFVLKAGTEPINIKTRWLFLYIVALLLWVSL